jgi:hypothetical protein
MNTTWLDCTNEKNEYRENNCQGKEPKSCRQQDSHEAASKRPEQVAYQKLIGLQSTASWIFFV